jgi:hypothetical protein
MASPPHGAHRQADARGFEIVSQSVVELDRFGKAMAQSPIEEPALGYRVVTAKQELNGMRGDATAAFNTLQRLAGGKRIKEGLLHDKRREPSPPAGIPLKGWRRK